MNTNLLKASEQFVKQAFAEADTSTLYYHNFFHTSYVVQTIQRMAIDLQLTDNQTEIVLIAGWFHDIGYLFTYHEHEAKSIEIATNFLAKLDYPTSKMTELTQCIEATKVGCEPATTLAAIVKDADLAFGVLYDFKTTGDALRKEWAALLDRHYTETAWETVQIAFLKQIHFYSSYGQKYFQHIVDDFFSF